jgi:Ser-tRNA(Ala) deacylase AlaX
VDCGDTPLVEELFLDDSYLRECDAQVLSVNKGKYVVLDRTVFHPEEGGQPWDTGEIFRGEAFQVIYTGRFSGTISHEVDGAGLERGDEVRCVLDWDRRYRLMRSHTAIHVLWAALEKAIPGIEIIGTQVEMEHFRFDVRTERNVLIEKMSEIETLANSIVKEDRLVTARILDRTEAEEVLKSYGEDQEELPQEERLRIVEVKGWDVSACVGTHVRRTGEIGSINIIKRTSKGKDLDRIYLTIE